MLFICGESRLRVFIVSNLDGMYIFSYNYSILKENGIPMVFTIEDEELKYKNDPVEFTIGVEGINIKTSKNKHTNVIREIFDKKPYKIGGEAYVYHPSVISNKENYVTRISNIRTTFMFPSETNSVVSDYCLLPESTCSTENLFFSEIRFGLETLGILKTYSSLTMSRFMMRFRNLFVGLKVFKNIRFFHGDISISNILVSDDVFRFIDFDRSFFLDNDKGHFGENVYYHTIPCDLCRMLCKHYSRNSKKPFKHDVRLFSQQKNFLDINFKDDDMNYILLNNINPSGIEDPKTFNHGNIDEIASYVSIYQLTIALFFYVEKLYMAKMSKSKADQFYTFSDRTLNYKKHGMIDIDSVLEMYDEIVRT